jgi:glucose uptake protein GlcU
MIEVTIVAIVFGLGLFAVSRMHKSPQRDIYGFLCGITWIFAGVSTFGAYDPAWVIIIVALGIFLLYDSATELMTWK